MVAAPIFHGSDPATWAPLGISSEKIRGSPVLGPSGVRGQYTGSASLLAGNPSMPDYLARNARQALAGVTPHEAVLRGAQLTGLTAWKLTGPDLGLIKAGLERYPIISMISLTWR